MELTTIWFVAIAVLWTGYLVLEGFDFGVGMLTALLARSDRERRLLLTTIGPVWDGNEVWLIVAGGATFAAFPEWYATLFSGFYLPLFAILVALILRAVALEYRSKRPEPAWRRRWDVTIAASSFVAALLWGVALAAIVGGTPIDSSAELTGTVLDLLTPYALLGGAVTLTVFLVHGAFFVALKTVGDIRHRARILGLRLAGPAAMLTAVFVTWTAVRDGDPVVAVAACATVVLFVGGVAAAAAGREGWAFAGTALAIVAVGVTLFTALFPDVMPSSLDPAWSLTVENASSTAYTLKIMTWVAVFFAPIVLGYQAWSYWVFRQRLGTHHIPEEHPVGSAGSF